MSTKTPSPEEEIDLGNLFNQLGKLIGRFYDFIGRIFSGIYHYFILTLIFLRKHYIVLGSALILGATIGFVLNKISDDIYRYDMILEPHYDGAYQINERIQYYNNLIKENDSITLSKLFNIDYEDANSLVKFEKRRLEDAKSMIEGYDEFIQDKDSITLTNVDYRKFADPKFSDFDAKFYAFRMYLNKSNLKRNIQNELMADLEKNEYLQTKHDDMQKRLNQKESRLLKILENIDSVLKKNKEIALIAAKNGSGNKSILDINESSTSIDRDINLFNMYNNTAKDLDTLLVTKEKYANIYNVITPFEALGIDKKSILEKKPILSALVLFAIVLLVLVLFQINNYLKDYK